jgi:hypothetical protein
VLAWVSVIDARTAMGREQVQAQQGGMEDRIKRRGPGVRVCRSGEGSSCPSKGSASLVEILAIPWQKCRAETICQNPRGGFWCGLFGM